MLDDYKNQFKNLLEEEKTLKRTLDYNYYDKNKRDAYFIKLKNVQNEIKKVKFKIMLEKNKK